MRSIVLLFVLLTTFTTWSQRQSVQNKSEWNKLLQISKEFSQTGDIDPLSLERFPIYNIHGYHYISLYGKTVPAPSWSQLQENGVLVGTDRNGIATIKVPLEILHETDLSAVYSYVEIPAKAHPDLKRAVADTKADSVQHGWGLPEAFTGEDVLIGITDWGFDYTHPMFYDTLLQQTRILAAWDQYRQTGSTPSGYAYGVELDTPSELFAAGTDTANIYSYNTHGTHVGGIAGGSGAGTEYRGFAFESQFLFATFLIDAASVIDAFHWMKDKADAQEKRLVINMSWGLYYMGTLDGNSLLSQAIGSLADEGVVFVSSAGNNGDSDLHIKKVFDNDSFTSRINFYPSGVVANLWGQSVTMWGEQNQPFQVAVDVYYSNNTLQASSPLYSTEMNGYLDSMLIVNVTGTNDTIFFNVSAENENPLNNRPNMRLRVKSVPAYLRIILRSAATAGTVHYWNVAELTTGVGNMGYAFTSYGTNGIAGDSKYSIGEPTCSPDVISVGAYSSGYFASNGTPLGGSQASFTSEGPLYTEVMKPDISAPGVNVASSISSFTDASYTPVTSIEFNNTTYDFAKFSGTSMASPCVTGIVALMLDANPLLSPVQVKQIIKNTARLDNHTGAISAPGHPRWGMGKINAYAAVIAALNTVSIEELQANEWVIAYPNPASSTVQILTPENQSFDEITLISSDGKRIIQPLQENAFDCSGLQTGAYIIEGLVNGKTVRTRFVKL
jgi:minor extracellular serine protease Vpr